MRHRTTRQFWQCYHRLPEEIQQLADKQFDLLKRNPRHPSLHFKRVGRYYSARVGRGYRTAAIVGETGLVWFWIGYHDEYERILK